MHHPLPELPVFLLPVRLVQQETPLALGGFENDPSRHQTKENGGIDPLLPQEEDGLFGKRRQQAFGEFLTLNRDDRHGRVFRGGAAQRQ